MTKRWTLERINRDRKADTGAATYEISQQNTLLPSLTPVEKSRPKIRKLFSILKRQQALAASQLDIFKPSPTTHTCETNSCSAATGGVRMMPSALAAIHSGLVLCSSASDRQETTVPENSSYSYFVYESATNLLPSWGWTTDRGFPGCSGTHTTFPKPTAASVAGSPLVVMLERTNCASETRSCLHRPSRRDVVVDRVAGGHVQLANSRERLALEGVNMMEKERLLFSRTEHISAYMDMARGRLPRSRQASMTAQLSASEMPAMAADSGPLLLPLERRMSATSAAEAAERTLRARAGLLSGEFHVLSLLLVAGELTAAAGVSPDVVLCTVVALGGGTCPVTATLLMDTAFGMWQAGTCVIAGYAG